MRTDTRAALTCLASIDISPSARRTGRALSGTAGDRRSRPQRLTDAVDTLRTLQQAAGIRNLERPAPQFPRRSRGPPSCSMRSAPSTSTPFDIDLPKGFGQD